LWVSVVRDQPCYRPNGWRGGLSAATFLRADAEKTGMPLERDVESVVNSVTKLWNAAPLPELQENCDAMLTQLREGPDGE